MQEIMTGAARQANAVTYYGPDGFKGMRRAGRLAAECLDQLYDIVRPGVTTQTIDDFIFDFGLRHAAEPATLNYRGYRKSSCTSVNHVVCHGIPNEKPLREGDIVNIDVTFVLDGWHGDFEPHVRRRPSETRRRTAGRGDLRVPDARHRGDPSRRPHGRHRPRHPDLCRGAALLGRARLLRPRRRPRLPRAARTFSITARPARVRRSSRA